MKLLLHFIRKDLAALRWWLALWIVACLAHFSLRLVQLRAGDAALPEIFRTSARPDSIAILLLLVLIVPQLVQLDPPARSSAFWKTVPLSSWRVLAGKLVLGGALFLLFPLALELLYFALAGFGWMAWAAAGAWLLRTLPLVLIAAGAAALCKNLRITLLLTLAAGFAAALPLLPHGPAMAGPVRWNLPALAGAGPWLGAVALALCCWQYLTRGRKGWSVAATALLITFPLRDGVAPARPAAQDAEPKAIAMPAGLDMSIDSLPELITFSDTKSHGSICAITLRLAMEHWLDGVCVTGEHFTDCRLILPDRTIQEASPTETEGAFAEDEIYRAPATLRELAALHPGDRIPAAVPPFRVSMEELEQGPAYLEGRLRLRLGHIHALGSSPLAPGILWRDGLTALSLQRAPRRARSSPPLELRIGLLTTCTGGAPKSLPPRSSLLVLLHHDSMDLENIIERVRSNDAGATLSGREVSSWTDLTRDRTSQQLDVHLQFAAEGVVHIPAYDVERLAFEFGDSRHFRLDLEENDDLGEVEIAVRIGPLMQAPAPWRTLAGEARSNAFGEALAQLELKNPADRAEVGAYLDKLMLFHASAPKDLAERFENELLVKLAAPGPASLEELLRRADSLTAPTAFQESRNFNAQQNLFAPVRNPREPLPRNLSRVICDLADDAHQEILLRSLSPHLDLMDAVIEHGWAPAALPVIAQNASTHPLPPRWIDLLTAGGERQYDPQLVRQARLGALGPDALNWARSHPGFPAHDAWNAAWETAIREPRDLSVVCRFFAQGCAAGEERLPRDLFFLLHMSTSAWSWRRTVVVDDVMDAAKTATGIFSRVSDCPADPQAALSWLTMHSEQVRFNPTTRRYELH